MTVKTDQNKPLVKHKTIQVQFSKSTKAEDDEYYYFEGYGAVFGNKDSYGDIILKGAFVDSLKEMKPALCYQHWMSEVIGVIDEAYEDEKGLFIKCRIPKAHTIGSNVATLIKCGGLKEMSIGYSEVETSSVVEGEDKTEYLVKLKLYEISIVTHAANKEAVITGFKSMEKADSIKDVEGILREVGLSAKQAKTLISKVKEFSKRDASDNVIEKKDEEVDLEVEPRDVVPPVDANEALAKKLQELTTNREILNFLNQHK